MEAQNVPVVRALIMDLTHYIAGLRRQAVTLNKQIASITERGSRLWSRWGSEPFVEKTGAWLKELQRRRVELLSIATALEKGRAI